MRKRRDSRRAMVESVVWSSGLSMLPPAAAGAPTVPLREERSEDEARVQECAVAIDVSTNVRVMNVRKGGYWMPPRSKVPPIRLPDGCCAAP